MAVSVISEYSRQWLIQWSIFLLFLLGSARYIKADASFIFSFSNRDGLGPFKSLVYQNNANAMYTNNGYGPTFGGGHDIYIANNAIDRFSLMWSVGPSGVVKQYEIFE